MGTVKFLAIVFILYETQPCCGEEDSILNPSYPQHMLFVSFVAILLRVFDYLHYLPYL